MKNHALVFSPNNNAFYISVIVLFSSIVFISIELMNTFSWWLCFLNIFNSCLLLAISLVIKMNRQLIIINDTIYIYFFFKVIPVHLPEFKVKISTKKGKINLFRFESSTLRVKIYPRTYKKSKALIKVINQIIES